MEQVLSTRLTQVLQGLGILILVAVTGAIGIYARSGPPLKAQFLIGEALTLIAVVCLALFLVFGLSRVSANEQGIEVSRLGRRVFVPYGQIRSVSSIHFLTAFLVVLPLVTVSFEKMAGGRQRVRFIARFTLTGWVRGVHPDVIMLKSRTGV